MFDIKKLKTFEYDDLDDYGQLKRMPGNEAHWIKRRLRFQRDKFREVGDPYFAMAAFRECAKHCIPPPSWVMEWLSLGMDEFQDSFLDDGTLSDLGELLGFRTQKSCDRKTHYEAVTLKTFQEEHDFLLIDRLHKVYDFSQAIAAEIVAYDNTTHRTTPKKLPTNVTLESNYSRYKNNEPAFAAIEASDVWSNYSPGEHTKQLKSLLHPQLSLLAKEAIRKKIAEYESVTTE